MKAIFVISIAKRYYEFCHNFPEIVKQAKEELGYIPEIIVVWSEPEPGRQWIFDDVMDTTGVTFSLLTRQNTERYSISYNCSQDMWTGFNHILHRGDEDYYFVFHCCDAKPKSGVYSRIDGAMQTGRDAFVLMMDSKVMHSIWHTNFFAVSQNQNYWPPQIDKQCPDILEAVWAKKLRDNGLKNYTADNNLRDKIFHHIHQSELYPEYEFHPNMELNSIPLFLKTTEERSWLKWLSNLTQKLKLFPLLLTGLLLMTYHLFALKKVIMKMTSSCSHWLQKLKMKLMAWKPIPVLSQKRVLTRKKRRY